MLFSVFQTFKEIINFTSFTRKKVEKTNKRYTGLDGHMNTIPLKLTCQRASL